MSSASRESIKLSLWTSQTRRNSSIWSPNYAANYRSVQEAIAAELPESFEVRQRAYLLLKRHGQELCKRSKPLCEQCPLTAECAYFQKGRKEWKPTYPELTRERVH